MRAGSWPAYSGGGAKWFRAWAARARYRPPQAASGGVGVHRLAHAVHGAGSGGGLAEDLGGVAGALPATGGDAQLAAQVLELAGTAADGFVDLAVRDLLADAHIHDRSPPLRWGLSKCKCE